MIDLYAMGSPNVVKIYIALEEMGLPYKVHPVDVFAEGAGLRIELVSTDHLVERDGHLLLPSGDAILTDDDVRELRLADQR